MRVSEFRGSQDGSAIQVMLCPEYVTKSAVDSAHCKLTLARQHYLDTTTGIGPGNHERTGKRLSGKPRTGSAWLRRSLCQAAWAASHTKKSDLATRFRRLAARKGKKRAIVAVAHTTLSSRYHRLKTKQTYRELGAGFLDRRHAEQRECVIWGYQLNWHITDCSMSSYPWGRASSALPHFFVGLPARFSRYSPYG